MLCDDDELLTAAGAVTLDRSTLTGWIETVTVGDIEETLGYDDFGAVESSEVIYDGTTSLFEYTLARDELGRITEQTESVEGNTPVVWSYQYDERGRLSRVDRGMLYVEYDYDANGNRLSVAVMGGMPTEATYDEQDRIESYGSIEFEHGAAGEIIEKRYDEFDAREYEFDALGNLLRVTLPDSTEISYDYDARGRLIARYVDEAFDKGWLWQDQLNPVAEVDEEGEVTARYVYGSRGHVPDYVVTGGETYRIITDYRGSVRMVVDDEGDVVETIEYGPWGEIFAQSGTALQSFGFAGGMWDRDTDLVRFGARWYDPEIGRWIMKDPIGFAGRQANLYVYTYNDPVDFIDPSGAIPRIPMPFGDPLPYGNAISAARDWLDIKFRGERDPELESYYAAKNYSVKVYRGGILDWKENWSRSAYTWQGAIHYGSNCDPFARTNESYYGHPADSIVADHELAHVLGYRDNWLGYSIMAIASRFQEMRLAWQNEGVTGLSNFEMDASRRSIGWEIK